VLSLRAGVGFAFRENGHINSFSHFPEIFGITFVLKPSFLNLKSTRKRIKVKSRRKKVVDNWTGSPFSYLQFLYQQLRSDNEMGVALRLRFRQIFGLTESIDEKSFNDQHPNITVGDVLQRYLQLELEETQIIKAKTPNSRKRARRIKTNRNKRAKLAMDSLLSPDRMAGLRVEQAKRMCAKRLQYEYRSHEAKHAAANRSAKQTARLNPTFNSQPQRESESEPIQLYNLNECTIHSDRQIQIEGYELGPGSWEEFKESLPTVAEDRCFDYTCVKTKDNKRIFILRPSNMIAPLETIPTTSELLSQPYGHPNPRCPRNQPKIAVTAPIIDPFFFMIMK
jgi:hypothetical protein